MIKRMLFILQMLAFGSTVYAQTAGDYLILQDIAHYKLTKGFLFRGKIVGAEPKVSRVGNDVYGYYTSYETSYAGGEGYSAPTVEVRVYDSTQWLLHEVEERYRDPDMLEANLTEGTVLRLIDGNRVFNWGAGTYTWVSGTNIVVRIEYIDLTGAKPEPLEVVKAYLQKFPSNITLTDAELKTKAHSEKWIKDEMNRRLWLCDKWFYQLQLKKVDEKQVYQESVKSMNVFLDYREKYYGIKAADEKNLLAGYLNSNNGTGIKAKLKEYKDWWSLNKDKAITLP